MKIIKDKSVIGWLKKDWVSLLIDIAILAFVYCRTINIDTLLLTLYVISITIDHHNKYIRYKERNNENS